MPLDSPNEDPRAIASSAEAAAEADDAGGDQRRIGPYLLSGRLGVGGMGEVYRAYDERLERWVALKHILPEAAQDQGAWERLRREARAVAGLNHAAIVRIHDILESDDVETEDGDWIVMELVEGKTLLDLINDDALTLLEATRVGQEIAEGLAAAHEQGVIHRDLKAENIMVTPEGNAKILDFGLAKRVFAESGSSAVSSMSQHGWIQGTGRAMSPEQVNGKALDHRTDLFSLGTLLFEAFTGHSPFLDAKGFVQTLMRVCQHQQPSARSLNTRVPEDLAALIDRLLEKDPDQRPQTAQETAQALRRIVAELEREQPAAIPRQKSGGPLRGVALESTRIAATRLAPLGDTEEGVGEDDESVGLRPLVRLGFTDRDEIADQLGEYRSFLFFARHDRLVRELLASFGGLEIKKTDIFLLLFEHPLDAVFYGLEYRAQLVELCAAEEIATDYGIAIHLGEVFEKAGADASTLLGVGAHPLELEAESNLILERFGEAAAGGRILMNAEIRELAEEGLQEVEDPPELFWQSHGLRHFPDLEVTEVHEVGDRPILPMDMDEEEREDVRRFVLRRRLTMATAAVLFLVLSGLAWFVLPQILVPGADSSTPAPRATPRIADLELRDSVAVLGFENKGAAEAAWLSTALSELISTELAIGAGVRMISGENVARMKAELGLQDSDEYSADTLAAIGKNLNADYVVTGSYETLEDADMTLSVRVQRTEDGDSVHHHTDEGVEANFFEIVTRSGGVLREFLNLEGEVSTEAVRAMLPSDPEAGRHYANGLDALRKYDPVAAKNSFVRAQAREPDFALTHARLAEAYSELGHDPKALESARRAFDLAQEKTLPGQQVLLVKGLYYEAAKDWEQAVETYRYLLSLFPDDIDYGLRLAQAQISAGLGEDALKSISTLRRLPAGEEDPRLDLAEAGAARVLARYAQMEKVLQRAIELGLEQEATILVAEALTELAWVYRRYGRLQDAQEALRDAQERFDRAGVYGKVGDVLYNIGQNSSLSGEIAEAEETLQESLTILRETENKRSISLTYQALGSIRRYQGNLDGAAQMFQAAIGMVQEVGDRRLAAYYGGTLAQVYLDRGEIAKAEELAVSFQETGAELNSLEMQGWSYRLLGSIAAVTGELDYAYELYQNGVEAARELQYPQMEAESLTGLAEIDYLRGNFERSLDYSSQGLELYGELLDEIGEANEYLQLARTHAALSRWDEALSFVEQSRQKYRKLQFEGSVLETDAVRAEILLQSGDVAAAREFLDPALRYALEQSQMPTFRIYAEILDVRLSANSGDLQGAERALEPIRRELQDFWLIELDLELLLAEAEVKLLQGDETANGVLQGLVERAEEENFGWIARKARRLQGARE